MRWLYLRMGAATNASDTFSVISHSFLRVIPIGSSGFKIYKYTSAIEENLGWTQSGIPL